MIFFSESSEDLQFIFKEKISDHKPIFAQGILSWNILCLSRMGNNGFHMDETLNPDLYKTRLQKIATWINYWVKTSEATGFPIKIICLQEAPFLPEYLNFFLNALNLPSFNMDAAIYTRTGSHLFQNLTLYSNNYVGKLITNLIPVNSDCQNNRYHIVELIHKENGVKNKIGNMHLLWMLNINLQQETQTVIKMLLLQNCSLVGDFNQSLFWIMEDAELKNIIKFFYYPEHNNMVSSIVHYGQIDALILQTSFF